MSEGETKKDRENAFLGMPIYTERIAFIGFKGPSIYSLITMSN